MSRQVFTFLALAALATAPLHAKGKFDGTYPGDATGKVLGQKISLPVSLKIKGQKLTGKIQAPGAGKIVSITGSVNGGSGHLIGFVTAQFGITGQFTGKASKAGKLTAGGALFVPGIGTVNLKITANKLDVKSPFRGTWVATHPPGQAIIKVDVLVTPSGIASVTFHENNGQIIQDNREVSDDGQFNSVVNGFIYFVKLNKSGSFSGTYQGVLGNGSFSGTRTSMGGVETSIAGAYAAISNDITQSSNKLRFVVANDRSLAGSFEFRNGSAIPFTNIVGDLDDFTGTTAGGISYFAKIAGDGTFTLTYQSAAYGNGSFAGKKK
jgi:hypothetical protein